MGLSAPCAGSLSPQTLGWLSNDQAHFMPPAACGSFSLDQTAQLHVQCGSFSPNCIREWSVVSVPAMNYTCISMMGPANLAAFSPDQVGAINNDAVVGIQGWNCVQMTTGCAGFKAAQFAGMSTSAFRQCLGTAAS